MHVSFYEGGERQELEVRMSFDAVRRYGGGGIEIKANWLDDPSVNGVMIALSLDEAGFLLRELETKS